MLRQTDRLSKTIVSLIISLYFFTGFYAVEMAAAQGPTPDAVSNVSPVTVEAYASHARIAPGGSINVAVRLSVESGWHVNSNKPNEDFLIATELGLTDGSPFSFGIINYPAGKNVRLEFSPDVPLSVYDGEVWITARLKSAEGVSTGAATIPLSLTAQACDDRSCVVPVTHELPLEIEFASAEPVSKHDSLFEALGLAAGSSTPAPPVDEKGIGATAAQEGSQGFWAMLKDFKAEDFIEKYGYILAFIAMYLLGLGLTLTPCVYPIIPITIGYFGSQASGKMSRQFAMAGIFGIGIAISYSAVGTVAAFSGSLMGAALQNPIVLIALAALCFIMGLNAFGVFEIALPGWLMGMVSGPAAAGRKGILGAAVMGLTMGIAAAPCLAAFIVSLLAFVGQKGDPLLGFSMFFTLGLGLATPFVALGTFSGLVSKAPKSGAWMVYAKKVMGALLFGATLYFLNTLIPAPLHKSLVVVALTAAGLYFGFFEKTPVKTWRFRTVRLIFAALFIFGAIWYNTPARVATENAGGIAWQKFSEVALEQARAGARPVVIDFYADWCIPCKELDKFSFSDPRVIEASRNMVMLKADLTKGNSPEVKALTAEYMIRGVPTIVFIGPDGQEVTGLRINQFEKADVVLARFNGLLNQNSGGLTSIAVGK